MASYADRENGNIQPVCQNCATSTTPLWRRDEMGSVLCNACGLFLKLHGTPRPISLKTDIIKSRNRVKTAGQGQKRKSLFDSNSIPIPQADLGTPHSNVYHDRRVPHKTSSGGSEPSDSPVSRTETPAIHHPSNIAPQHLFDSVALADHVFHSPAISGLQHPSPGSSSPFNDRNVEPPRTYDAMLQEITTLKTRVSELEVINELYRGTLEQYHQGGAPPAEMVPRDPDSNLRKIIEQSQQREQQQVHREQELLQKIEKIERENAELRGHSSPSKRARLSDEAEYPEPPEIPTNGLHS